MFADTDKRLAKLERSFSKIKELEKEIRQIKKDLNSFKKKAAEDISGNAWLFKKHIDAYEKTKLDNEKAFKEIKVKFAEIDNKNKKVDKKLRALDQTDKKIRNDIKTANGIIKKINRTFNAESLRTLRADLDILTESISSIEKENKSMLNRLSKMTGLINTVKENAVIINAESQNIAAHSEQLDLYAKDLKKLAEEYFNRMEEINNKINATIASISDLSKIAETLKSQITSAQNRLALLDRLKEDIEAHKAMLADLKRKFEYLDKTCTKTIVLE